MKKGIKRKLAVVYALCIILIMAFLNGCGNNEADASKELVFYTEGG